MSEKHSNRWLEREDDGDLTIVRILEDKLAITDHTRAVFDQIYTLVDDMNRHKMILDMKKVQYVSSLALGKLVMLNRKILSAEGRLALCNLTEHVAEVMEVSHLNELFNIYETEQQARESF